MPDLQETPRAAQATPSSASQPAPDVQTLVQERRLAAGIGADEPLWGLALSGGGIRSATFALGLIRALAERRLLSRFDLLSTVSGGGYAGAAIGKLFHDAGPAPAPGQGAAQQVQADLAKSNASWMVWWLRATSRYLAPRGGKDLLQAGALVLRNLLAIHLELALVFVFLGGVMALLHVGIWRELDMTLPVAHPYPVAATYVLQPWMSIYWLLLVVPFALAAPSVAAYWALPSDGVRRRGELRVVAVLGVLTMLLAAGLRRLRADCSEVCWDLQPIGWTVCGLLALLVVAPLIARACLRAQSRKLRRTGGPEPECDVVLSAARTQLTRWLTGCLRLALLLVFLGVIDRLAWALAMQDQAPPPWLTPVVLAVILAVVRFAAARMAGQTSAPAMPRGTFVRIINAAGLLLLVLLGAWWVSLVYQLALGPIFPGTVHDEAAIRAGTLNFRQSIMVLAGCLAIPAAYIVLTWRNWDFLNTSSLHMFYRGRLVRSYLGAVNRERFHGVAPLQPVDPSQVDPIAQRKTVFDVVPGDGVGLDVYAPHRSGGPVHLVNVTLNQSYDARGGLYNQDRKGQSLCITSGGLHRLGLASWQIGLEDMRRSELASWMAISGAAFTPGLGGQTSPGLAALLFMSGVRLGYWWPNPAPGAGFLSSPSKYGLLLQELRGSFGGDGAPCWYLSDGGHFENTGAYALLAERARLIVVSDAGADPTYQFEDLENLVRKARIDLGADIEFLRPVPPERASVARTVTRFGSISDLRDPRGEACLSLAKVHYRRDGPGAPHGWLVLVKPNIYEGLPVDLVNYKASCPSFPQETTTDQFFSEKQWESYYVLGERLGLELRQDLLEGLVREDPTWTGCFEPDVAALDDVRAARAAASQAAGAAVPRYRTAAASGAGLALLASAVYAGWQGWDAFQNGEARHRDELQKALSVAAGRHEQLLAGDLRVLPELKSTLADIAQRECANSPSLLAGSPYARMFADVEARCPADSASPSCAILHETVPQRTSNCFVAGFVDPGAPHYWGRPYHWPKLVERAPVASDTTVAAAQPVVPAAEEAPPTPPAAAPAPAPAAAPRAAPRAAPAPVPLPPGAPPTGVVFGGAGGSPPASRGPASDDAEAPTVLAQAQAPCAGKTIYIQRYGPATASGDVVATWRATNEAQLAGATVPPVEDVWDSARRRGRPLARPAAGNVAIFHTPAEMACAQSLRDVKARPLAPSMHGTPGVVEVWLSPAKE